MRRRGIFQARDFFEREGGKFPMLFQRRGPYFVEKSEDGSHVRCIKGWENDQAKRQAFTTEI